MRNVTNYRELSILGSSMGASQNERELDLDCSYVHVSVVPPRHSIKFGSQARTRGNGANDINP